MGKSLMTNWLRKMPTGESLIGLQAGTDKTIAVTNSEACMRLFLCLGLTVQNILYFKGYITPTAAATLNGGLGIADKKI